MPCGGGWRVLAQSALKRGRGRGGLVHPNPYHLPRVTRYFMSMLSLHDQGG